MKLSKKYAKKLGYDEHDVKLATLIGLFHDIGRFEQLKFMIHMMIGNLLIMLIMDVKYYSKMV